VKTELDKLIGGISSCSSREERVQAQVGAMLTVAERVLMSAGAIGCLALVAYFTYRGNLERAGYVQSFHDKFFGSSASSPYVSGDVSFSPASEAEISAMTPTEIDAIAKSFAQGQSLTGPENGTNLFGNAYETGIDQSFGGVAEAVPWVDNPDARAATDATASYMEHVKSNIGGMPPDEQCNYLRRMIEDAKQQRYDYWKKDFGSDQAMNYTMNPGQHLPNTLIGARSGIRVNANLYIKMLEGLATVLGCNNPNSKLSF